MKCPWCFGEHCPYSERTVTKADVMWLLIEKARALRLQQECELDGFLTYRKYYKRKALRRRSEALEARYYCALSRFNELRRGEKK